MWAADLAIARPIGELIVDRPLAGSRLAAVSQRGRFDRPPARDPRRYGEGLTPQRSVVVDAANLLRRKMAVQSQRAAGAPARSANSAHRAQSAIHAGLAKKGLVRKHKPQTAAGAVSTARAHGVNASASFAWTALEG